MCHHPRCIRAVSAPRASTLISSDLHQKLCVCRSTPKNSVSVIDKVQCLLAKRLCIKPRLPNRRHYTILQSFFSSTDIETQHGYEDYLQMLDAVEQCTNRELCRRSKKQNKAKSQFLQKRTNRNGRLRNCKSTTSTRHAGCRFTVVAGSKFWSSAYRVPSLDKKVTHGTLGANRNSLGYILGPGAAKNSSIAKKSNRRRKNVTVQETVVNDLHLRQSDTTRKTMQKQSQSKRRKMPSAQ